MLRSDNPENFSIFHILVSNRPKNLIAASLVAPTLHEDVEHDPLLNLIQVPLLARSRPTATQLVGDRLSEIRFHLLFD